MQEQALIVGVDGDATLNVSDGGALISDNPRVGLGSGSAKVTIDGTGSRLGEHGRFDFGTRADHAVSAGATMSTAGSSVIR